VRITADVSVAAEKGRKYITIVFGDLSARTDRHSACRRNAAAGAWILCRQGERHGQKAGST
jgi:hypothetical protein